jgi:hypothetical protein
MKRPAPEVGTAFSAEALDDGRLKSHAAMSGRGQSPHHDRVPSLSGRGRCPAPPSYTVIRAEIRLYWRSAPAAAWSFSARALTSFIFAVSAS